MAPQSRIALDRFLLNFLCLFEQQVPTEFHNPAMPDWLAYAVTEIQHPRHFHDGMRAFVELAGHCQAHVIRETRKWLKKHPANLSTRPACNTHEAFSPSATAASRPFVTIVDSSRYRISTTVSGPGSRSPRGSSASTSRPSPRHTRRTRDGVPYRYSNGCIRLASRAMRRISGAT